MNASRFLGISLLVLLLPACEGGDVGRKAPVVRDSVGIQIVQNDQEGWGADEGWLVESEAILVLGESGREEDVLFRVLSPIRLGDGRVVFSNMGMLELRIYDENGTLLSITGREGEGPGEYRDTSSECMLTS